MCIGHRVKYPLILLDINQTSISWIFSKNTQKSNLLKIRPLGAEGQKDMTKLTVAFRNLAIAPNNHD